MTLVRAPRGRHQLAIECKWSARDFDVEPLRVFRRMHPSGENVVVAHDVDRPFKKTWGDVTVNFENLPTMLRRLV